MGGKLRSGRKIASLSPPNKRAGGNSASATAAEPKAAPKAPPKATPKAPPKANPKAKATVQKTAPKPTVQASIKGAINNNRNSARKTIAKNNETRKGKKEDEIVESESCSDEDDEEDEESGSENESEECCSEDRDSKVSNFSAPTPKRSNVSKSNVKKAESSDEEESDDDDDDDEDNNEEDDESDDEMKKVIPTPLKKSQPPHNDEEDESSDENEDSDEDNSIGYDAKDNGFTDENATWLKPKQSKMSLIASDEEQSDDEEFNAESSGDDEDDELLEVERQSRLIDAEMKLEQDEAEQEMRRTIAQQTAVFHLPTAEELEDDMNRVVPPSELRTRIEDILEVLADFKTRREPGRSRSEYIERLAQDMAELFGYLQELVDYFLSMFGPNECLEFLEASDKSRPLVVRVNTLKARRKDLAAALMKRGVRLDPLAPWSKVGLKIYESTVPIGATPEYLAGHYMLQSAASMCPVMALGPQPGDRILDMSAAPGGKTSYISQLMRNKGVVIANDLKAERQKATVANLHRLGVRNVVTCCYDGRKIGSQMRNSFDRILLDAPCSGLGVISRDPSVKVQRTIPEVQRCAHLQKELLVAAIDALNHKSKKGGGFMVYSTCSVAVAENEEVVNYLLSKRDVKLVDTGLDFGKPGFTRFEHKRFHPSVALTRRFYPHVHNMDGFYVAKIQKLSDKRKGEEDKPKEENVHGDVKDDTTKLRADDNNQKSTRQSQKGNKRCQEFNVDADDDETQNKVQKRSKISVAPNVQGQKSKNKKTNSKTTKPRRMKITGM